MGEARIGTGEGDRSRLLSELTQIRDSARTGVGLTVDVTGRVIPALFVANLPSELAVRAHRDLNPQNPKGVYPFLYFHDAVALQDPRTKLGGMNAPSSLLFRVQPELGEITVDNPVGTALVLEGTTIHPTFEPLTEALHQIPAETLDVARTERDAIRERIGAIGRRAEERAIREASDVEEALEHYPLLRALSDRLEGGVTFADIEALSSEGFWAVGEPLIGREPLSVGDLLGRIGKTGAPDMAEAISEALLRIKQEANRVWGAAGQGEDSQPISDSVRELFDAQGTDFSPDMAVVSVIDRAINRQKGRALVSIGKPQNFRDESIAKEASGEDSLRMRAYNADLALQMQGGMQSMDTLGDFLRIQSGNHGDRIITVPADTNSFLLRAIREQAEYTMGMFGFGGRVEGRVIVRKAPGDGKILPIYDKDDLNLLGVAFLANQK